MKINILGTEYEVVFSPENEHDPKLSDCSGYMEPYAKKLVVEDFTAEKRTVQNPELFKKKVLRHEIVHAFLHESGLRESSWGDNEEIVDWLAYQGPKIFKAWQEADAL
jgi:hypothetical protein